MNTSPGNVFYPPHDVDFDSRGVGWFTTLSRRLPVSQQGNAEDQRCGPVNATTGDPFRRDRWGCGRIGRFGPGGLRYFTAAEIREPWAVETVGNSIFVSDRRTSRIWRIQNSNAPVDVVRLFEAPRGTPRPRINAEKALRPTELLRVGNRVWYVAVHWNGQAASSDSALRAQIGRIGWFNAQRPAIRQSWRVGDLRDLAGLALDGQGRLWFTGNGDGPGTSPERGLGLGRLNPSAPNPGATIRVFRNAAFPSGVEHWPGNPTRIIRGPDGLMWFIDNGGKRICRFSPAAPIATLSCFERVDGGQPYDLTVGADGAVWYTDAALDRLGRFTTAGDSSVVEPTVPFDSPWGIHARSNGRLYVAAAASGRIPWYEP